MARIHHVKKAQQRYRTVPVLDEAGQPKVTTVLRKDGTPKTTKRGREVTRRVTVADKSQPLPNLTCGKCGVEIKPGDPYKWVKTKSGPYGGSTKYRCSTCPSWRPSELSSSKMAGIYAAQEHLADVLFNAEDESELADLATEFAEAVKEVAEEYRESQSNMVDGFGHETYISDELGEKADSLDDWASDIENESFDSFDEEEPTEDEFTDADGVVDTDAFEDAVSDWEQRKDEHWEEQRDKLDSMANECPV